MLTTYMVVTLLTSGEKGLEENQSMFRLIMCRSHGIFVKMHKYVTLVADVMFVNGLPFLVTSSRGMSLVTIEYLPSRTAKRLVNTLRRVFRIYRTGGYAIQMTLMDIDFEKLKPMLPEIVLNTTAAREHEGMVEWKIVCVCFRPPVTTGLL
jgi:hypothetical protein